MATPTSGKILVGLDGSPRAPLVLAEATRLARRTGSRLVVVRAVGLPIEMTPSILQVKPDELEVLLLKQGRTEIAALLGDVPPELIASTQVLVGTAWQVVCEVARKEDVELIVIGSHGYRGLDRILGTTAARVVNHADRSVLVVRAALQHEKAAT